MRKKLFLLMLLVACVALSGCALVVKDPVRDAQQVIVDVNGQTIDKQTMSRLITDAQNNTLNYYYQLYSMYGLQFDPSNVDLTQVPQQTIDAEVRRLVLGQKFGALGLSLTEDEEAEVRTHAEEEYNEILDQIKTQYLSESEKEGDELTEEAKAYALTLDDRLTLDYYLEHAREEKIEEKLREYAIRDVAVTEDDIKTEYDSRVASAKESYESNPDSFGTAVNNGSTVYYRPAGYRYVKQVLVGFSDETKQAVTDANSAVTAAQTAVDDAQKALDDNAAALAAEGLAEDEKASLTEATAGLQSTLDTAKADLAEKQAAAAKALEDAYASIQPTVDEVMEKVRAGEDFDALIEQYNTDPGMQREPGKTNGYAVREGFATFEKAFVDAAMALSQVGDVSEPVNSDNYGKYIIRYQSDIAEGDVPLEEVRSVIEPEVLSNKQDTTFDAAVEQWTKDADPKTYIERLSN